MTMRRHVMRGLQVVTALVGAFLLYRVLRQHDPREIAAAIRQIPPTNILLAVASTAGSYVCLAVSESMGLGYAPRRRVPASRVMLVTIAGLGIGHSVGLSALSSGAVRYRMYTRNGLNAEAVAKILIFSGLTVVVGLIAVFCLVIAVHGHAVASYLGMSPRKLADLIVGLVTALALYLALCGSRSRHVRQGVRIGRIRFCMPSLALAVGQIPSGATNSPCIAASLHVCLTPPTPSDHSLVVTLIVLADPAPIIGHVPGGWGVLEYVLPTFPSPPRP